MTPLDGYAALVAGATRGAGRAIAVELARAGATVYVTGRSTRTGRSELDRPETIDETAEIVERAGGRAIPLRVDHLDVEQVRSLAARISADHDGRLDILVNDIWGGDHLTGPWGVPFWQHSLPDGLRIHQLGFETHVITSWHLAPLLAASGRGLIVEVTDGKGDDYRDNLFYDLVKSSVSRLALAESAELAPFGGMAVGVTPGFLRSEAMLDHFAVTEATWRDAISQDIHFRMSETPTYVALAVSALASDADRHRWAGKTVASWEMAKHYGFTDVDGSQPDWGAYYRDVVVAGQPYDDRFRAAAAPDRD